MSSKKPRNYSISMDTTSVKVTTQTQLFSTFLGRFNAKCLATVATKKKYSSGPATHPNTPHSSGRWAPSRFDTRLFAACHIGQGNTTAPGGRYHGRTETESWTSRAARAEPRGAGPGQEGPGRARRVESEPGRTGKRRAKPTPGCGNSEILEARLSCETREVM